jgi:transcriptional regulator with XRE-family HTH domain
MILPRNMKSEVIDMGFPERLRESRSKKNLTQEGLAEVLNVSRQAVSDWERGNKYPEVEKLIALVQELDVHIDWLFEEEIKGESERKEDVPVLPGLVAGLEAFSESIKRISADYCSDTKKLKE